MVARVMHPFQIEDEGDIARARGGAEECADLHRRCRRIAHGRAAHGEYASDRRACFTDDRAARLDAAVDRASMYLGRMADEDCAVYAEEEVQVESVNAGSNHVSQLSLAKQFSVYAARPAAVAEDAEATELLAARAAARTALCDQ